jgi:midasin (ATPase involved in ribosome maturation)
MKHHIEVVISDSEWVDILTVHSETGSAIGSSVPIENVQELIYKLEKILNDKRNVQRGEEKSFKACKECPHPITKCSKIGHCDYE